MNVPTWLYWLYCATFGLAVGVAAASLVESAKTRRGRRAEEREWSRVHATSLANVVSAIEAMHKDMLRAAGADPEKRTR